MLDFIQGTVTNLIRAFLYLFLFYLIFTEKITFGQYLSLNIYSFWLFFPLTQFAAFIGTYRQAEASLANYTTLMNTSAEPNPSSPKSIGTIETLEFNNVSFAYKGGTIEALKNINYKFSNIISIYAPFILSISIIYLYLSR
mgnify:CR=1 FL=1